MTKPYYYYQHAGALNRELKRAIPSETLKALHHKSPLQHFLIAGRQLSLLVILPLIIYYFQHPLIWVPAMILMGFVIFGFTVLLHEVSGKWKEEQNAGGSVTATVSLVKGKLTKVLSWSPVQ